VTFPIVIHRDTKEERVGSVIASPEVMLDEFLDAISKISVRGDVDRPDTSVRQIALGNFEDICAEKRFASGKIHIAELPSQRAGDPIDLSQRQFPFESPRIIKIDEAMSATGVAILGYEVDHADRTIQQDPGDQFH
jgi:hypothetical protein